MKAHHLGLEETGLQNGPVPKRVRLEWLTDPEVLTEILYRTEELTDEAFNELIDDIGARAARLVLRTKALQGDIRALDLYLRIAREDSDKRRDRGKPVERTIHTTGFVQDGRNTTTKEVDPTTKVVNETSE